MNISEAIDALIPFAAKPPTEALEYLRAHWDEAAPVLLAEIEKRLEAPRGADNNALFLYAIHLCAEMRCQGAFPLFTIIARLPNLLLDNLIGDILTEAFPQMLARTCGGRIDDIKALIEDSAINEYARGSALSSLVVLVANGDMSQSKLSDYCIELLSDKLERQASFAWDAAIDVACELGVPGALPLIQAAYKRKLADSSHANLDERIKKYNKLRNVTLDQIRERVRPFRSTETEMAFFVRNWGKENADGADLDFLQILNDRKLSVREAPKTTGRNDPCPCGSGKKFKKCCLNGPQMPAFSPVVSVRGNLIRAEYVAANDWMEAGYRHLRQDRRWSAYKCWQNCWKALLRVLPPSLQNPEESEAMGAFEGYERLVNWLQDFENLLMDLDGNSLMAAQYAAQYFETVQNRFQFLNPDIKQNMQADQARCLALLGEHEKAIAILERMIEKRPQSAQGYVELADHYCLNASRFNRRLNIEKARQYLQAALKGASDCSDYDVPARLDDINAIEASMIRPLL